MSLRSFYEIVLNYRVFFPTACPGTSTVAVASGSVASGSTTATVASGVIARIWGTAKWTTVGVRPFVDNAADTQKSFATLHIFK